jgi:hypothetical protein
MRGMQKAMYALRAGGDNLRGREHSGIRLSPRRNPSILIVLLLVLVLVFLLVLVLLLVLVRCFPWAGPVEPHRALRRLRLPLRTLGRVGVTGIALGGVRGGVLAA